jgi:hypothetical protein
MTNLLLERNTLLKDLFPWDDINYGIDEQWARVSPYLQNASPGKTVKYSVKIFNHSEVPKTYIIEPNTINGFSVKPDIASVLIEPRTEGERTFEVKVSKKIQPGLSLLLFNIKFDNWDLREWSEALIEILPDN